MFSDTFAGIAPSGAPGYIVAQLAGGLVGVILVRTFYPNRLEEHIGDGENADEATRRFTRS
jgi:glycerol uptake facilitator-like aquaporin